MKIARKFEDLTNAVDFIRKKFADYEVEKRQKVEIVKSLRGQVSTLHNNLGS